MCSIPEPCGCRGSRQRAGEATTSEDLAATWRQGTPENRGRERSLLYVTDSRARDVLAVTWSGTPSELLPDSDPPAAVTA